MAGRVNGPRPGWENLPEERRQHLEEQRVRWFQMRADAKKYAKLEGFLQAHQESAANFFRDKIAFVNAIIDGVRDEETGEISVELVKQMDAKDKKILLDAFEKIEKSAGFQNKVTTHKHEHSLTMADKWKQMNQGSTPQIEAADDTIDVEVLGEE